MTKKLTSRLLSILVSLCMVLALFPTTAFAAEGDVAQIGDQTYKTLDEAIEAAEDGATIELLADATTSGMNLSKDITIQAAEGVVDPTITFTQYGIALWGVDLTFRNVNVVMNGIGSTPYTGEWNWMTICASADASMTLDNVDMTMDATGVSNSPHAIYFCNNNVLNVINGSNLTIKNYAQDALEWDGGNGGYNVNIIDSTFTSDHNRSGFTGTFYATITNSTVDVINSTGNGSNGSHFIITNSTVNFSDNGSHGLSAGELVIDHSTVTTENNKGMGISVDNGFTVKNGSIVTVTGNASNSSYGYAAVRLYNNFDFSVDGTSRLYIKGNNNTGLYVRQGNLTVADGAVLEITGNHVTHNALGGYGGGIYVGYGDNYDPTVVLPANAKIYNNHAITGGDDIYVSEGVNGPSLTFGQVGTDWVLDDCNHLIDGWYDDSADTRWEAHADIEADIHVEKFAGEFGTDTGLTTVTGLTQLKAAHGLDEKTSLPGLDKDILVTGEDGSETGVDTDTVTDGSTVKFQLKSNVPQNLKDYINYPETEGPEISSYSLGTANTYTLVFHDKMAAGLTLNSDSFQVMLGDEKITDNEYVTITTTGLTDDCTFEVSVNLAAMYNNDVITEQDLGVTPITVTYTATLPEGTVAGAYTNTAWVVYPDGESEESTVTVYTYGIDVFKYDQSTAVTDEETHEWSATGLPGAQFALYDESGVTVAEDGTVTVNEDAVAVWTGTSGADGHATIPGLDEGTYYLVETKAPDNYVMNTTPLEIEIPADADEATYMVHVNFANSPIPHTGGTGTMMYTIGGAAIVVIAGILLVVSRKSRKKQDR